MHIRISFFSYCHVWFHTSNCTFSYPWIPNISHFGRDSLITSQRPQWSQTPKTFSRFSIFMLKKYIHPRVGWGLVIEVLDFHPPQAHQHLPPITGYQLLGRVNPHPVGHARPPEKIELRTFHNLWQLLEELLRQLRMNRYLMWRKRCCSINLYGCHREEMSLSINAHQRDKINMATHLR